jgi:hypothetical protein
MYLPEGLRPLIAVLDVLNSVKKRLLFTLEFRGHEMVLVPRLVRLGEGGEVSQSGLLGCLSLSVYVDAVLRRRPKTTTRWGEGGMEELTCWIKFVHENNRSTVLVIRVEVPTPVPMLTGLDVRGSIRGGIRGSLSLVFLDCRGTKTVPGYVCYASVIIGSVAYIRLWYPCIQRGNHHHSV